MTLKSNYCIQRALLSNPDNLFFTYLPSARHIRLLQLQKRQTQGSLNNQDYIQNLHNRQQQYQFQSKRCLMLDHKLTVIEKINQGRPLDYSTKYKKYFKKFIKSKVFNWYTGKQKQQIGIMNQLLYYYSYPQITNFCFGRRHFIRSINAIELASDHISRDHCQVIIKEGKKKEDVKKQINFVFRLTYKKNKFNRVQILTNQIWLKIYQFIYPLKDMYFLVDNGSRNGTFFIEINKNILQQKCYQNTQFQKFNHCLLMKSGYSYEFQGQQYLIKVWQLTTILPSNKDTLQQIQNQPQHIEQFFFQSQNQSKSGLFVNQPSILYHNLKIIKKIKKYEQNMNYWANNFEKVSKEYIIQKSLLNYQQKQKSCSIIQQNISFQQSQQSIQIQNQNLDQKKKKVFLKRIWREYNQILKQNKKQNDKRKSLDEINTDQIKQNSSNQLNLQSFLISNIKLQTLIISLDYNNDFKKLFCIIVQDNKHITINIGPNLTINTLRYEFYHQSIPKPHGIILFNGYEWYLTKQKPFVHHINNNLNNKQKQNNLYRIGVDNQIDESDEFEEDQNCQNDKNKIQKKKQQVVYNLKNILMNRIWTKIPSVHSCQLNPYQNQSYILRLAHSFYFQLKFINYYTQVSY